MILLVPSPIFANDFLKKHSGGVNFYRLLKGGVTERVWESLHCCTWDSFSSWEAKWNPSVRRYSAFQRKPTHTERIKIWHSDGALTKKQATFIVYSALGPDKLHQMPGSPRGHCLPDRYSSSKGSVTATMSAWLFTSSLPWVFERTI